MCTAALASDGTLYVAYGAIPGPWRMAVRRRSKFSRLAALWSPCRLYQPKTSIPPPQWLLFPYSQLKFALSKGVIYPKTHEVLSEVEDRLLDQYVESQRSIQTRIGFQQHPRQAFELLDYAHFANKYAAHGERHKADLTYATYSLQRGVPEIEVRDTIRAHTSTSAFVNRSQRDKDAYIDRTVRKALKQNGIYIPIQPTLQAAELCR